MPYRAESHTGISTIASTESCKDAGYSAISYAVNLTFECAKCRLTVEVRQVHTYKYPIFRDCVTLLLKKIL